MPMTRIRAEMGEAEAQRIEDEWYAARSPQQITKELQTDYDLRCQLHNLVELMRDGLAEHGALCPCEPCCKAYGPIQSNL
jgi:hypothetical protein